MSTDSESVPFSDQPEGYDLYITGTALAKQMLEFSRKCPVIKPEEWNEYYKSKYASLGSILKVVKPILNECGMVILQSPIKNGEILETMLIHAESGEMLRFCCPIVKEGDKSQAFGKSLTYARRQAIASVLCLAIDEDDDGNPEPGGGEAEEMLFQIREKIRECGGYESCKEDISKYLAEQVSKGVGTIKALPDAPGCKDVDELGRLLEKVSAIAKSKKGKK